MSTIRGKNKRRKNEDKPKVKRSPKERKTVQKHTKTTKYFARSRHFKDYPKAVGLIDNLIYLIYNDRIKGQIRPSEKAGNNHVRDNCKKSG